VSIVVPNFNGRAHLERYFGSVVRVAAERPGTEVIVVDDASTDDSVAFLGRAFPGIRVIERLRNGGFGEAANTGAMAASGEILVFLMTDLEAEQGLLAPLLEHFADPKVFAVSPRIITAGAEHGDASITRIVFSRGMFHLDWPGVRPGYQGNGHPQEIAFATGGAMACDRAKFLALGGFDPLYAPFYWEDVDLSYRARRRGWRVLSEPQSVVYHPEPHAIISALPASRHAARISERNRFLFTWANADRAVMLLRHGAWSVPRLVLRLCRGEWDCVLAFLSALARAPRALARRRRDRVKPR
jgi:GT2 family glycosyltransferase